MIPTEINHCIAIGVFKTVGAKYNATILRISELNEKGQPVLVGTVSIEVSEAISKLLNKKGE